MSATALPHRSREPAGAPDGALILLHGRGTDEHDLHPLLEVLDPAARLAGVTPGGPLALPPGGRHWYAVERVGYPHAETFAAVYPALCAFLDGWLAERGIPWERTLIGGFSQGAVMSYAVGLGEGRPSPAGILALSGFVPTVDGWAPALEARRGLPVVIRHGTADPVISVEFARRARTLLEPAGLAVDYEEHPGAHQLDPRQLPALERWVAERVPPS